MSIKSYIQGKHITHKYTIKENRDNDTDKFKCKPELTTKDEIAWADLLVVDGEIGQTSRNTSHTGLWTFDMSYRINISETEEVHVEEKIYRADLHAYMVHTDKVITEVDAAGSEDIKHRYNVLVSEYNMQMIAADKKLEAYCGVHNLNPATTDYDELKKIVYGDYSIKCVKADYIPHNIQFSIKE